MDCFIKAYLGLGMHITNYSTEGDCSIRVFQSMQINFKWQKFLAMLRTKFYLLCLMLSGAYYAKHYASIIGLGLNIVLIA